MPYDHQRPGSDLDYSFDWSDYLDDQGSPSDTISTSTWSVAPDAGSPSPEVHSDVITGAITSAFLRNVTRGEVYVLKNHVVTAAGRSDVKQVVIRCD